MKIPLPFKIVPLLFSTILVGQATLACPSEDVIQQKWTPDGCSVPSGVAPIGEFHEACNTHDICYATLGRSKEECDNEFYNNMLNVKTGVCKATRVGRGGILIPNDEQSLICYSAAGIYNLAVVNHAQEAYDNAQRWAMSVCSPYDF